MDGRRLPLLYAAECANFSRVAPRPRSLYHGDEEIVVNFSLLTAYLEPLISISNARMFSETPRSLCSLGTDLNRPCGYSATTMSATTIGISGTWQVELVDSLLDPVEDHKSATGAAAMTVHWCSDLLLRYNEVLEEENVDFGFLKVCGTVQIVDFVHGRGRKVEGRLADSGSWCHLNRAIRDVSLIPGSECAVFLP